MRRVFILFAVLTLSASLAAQGVREEQPKVDVSIAALQGPTGFGLARILQEGAGESEIITIDSQVLPAPAEAVSRMASGELNAALLPVNLASVIFNRGLPFKAASVTGEGMIHLLSRDPSFSDWEDLAGRTVHVAARGATPDYLTRYILQQKGLLDAADLEYSITSAPQLAQMLIAARVEHIVVPEPFATMADLQGGDQVFRALDLQEGWKEVTGRDDVYPMTLLVISTDLIQNHPDAAHELMRLVRESIEWTKTHHQEASRIIEEFGILSAAMALPAIPNSGLTFLEMDQAKRSVEEFLQVLYSFDPSSVGGALPDEQFYWYR